jgi:RNA polymerase sigma-70 factor, ECF subfamily
MEIDDRPDEAELMVGDEVTGFRRNDRTEAVCALPFEQVWQQHRPRLQRLVTRLAGDAELAEDLTQEVGLRAFQAFPGFRGEADAYSWLYRIAINVVNRYRERRRPAIVPLDTPEVEGLAADRAGGPEAAFLRDDLRASVRKALDRLPDDLRTILILQVYEGLKYRELALILGIPIGTVKSRLHHAMQRLKEELTQSAV